MNATPDWFVHKIQLQALEIQRLQHWTWSLRPTQCTLGACVLSLNREASTWGEVTPEENAELSIVVSHVERRLRAAFAYDKINYLMLMMVDPHVHFHVVPRYASTIHRFGHDWQDVNWPRPPDIAAGPQEPALLAQVLASIRSA